MKKILILVSMSICLSFSAYAESINECKTDIYYGNGVWNTSDEAKDSREKLENRIVKLKIIKGNPSLKTKYGKVKLAYNWGQGTLLDILETYYQLRESGQLEGVGFFTAMAILTAYQPELTLGAIATQKLMEKYTKDWEQGNVDEMWNHHYYPESFKLGHRVLLVSHSQGNLFANRIYDTINPTGYKRYFANVQVASPASEVKADEVGKGSYVTLFGDPIINPIPRSMPGNAHGTPGHAFVTAYLDQQDPYDKIVSRIKAVLPTLDVELTQWDTEGEPSNKGTCEEKIKVKHSFDLAVDMPFDVYPFNLSKKLYQVKGEWVKASCGGNNILDQWDGKKDNECWMIDNVEEEKINSSRTIKFYVRLSYTDPTTISKYPGQVGGTGYYPNSDFEYVIGCSSDHTGQMTNFNSLKNFTLEQNLFAYTQYAGVVSPLACNLKNVNKEVSDISRIELTSIRTVEIKRDPSQYTYPNYFESYFEYTVYFK